MSKCNECSYQTFDCGDWIETFIQDDPTIFVRVLHRLVDIFNDEAKGRNRLFDTCKICPSGHVEAIFFDEFSRDDITCPDMSIYVNNAACIYLIMRHYNHIKETFITRWRNVNMTYKMFRAQDIEGVSHEFVNGLKSSQELHDALDDVAIMYYPDACLLQFN